MVYLLNLWWFKYTFLSKTPISPVSLLKNCLASELKIIDLQCQVEIEWNCSSKNRDVENILHNLLFSWKDRSTCFSHVII